MIFRVVVLVLLSGAAAHAQSLPSLDLQRLQLEPSALGSLMVSTGRTLEAGHFRTSLQMHYEDLPFTFRREWDPQSVSGLVETRLSAHLTGAYGVLPWLQLSAQVPFVAYQEGSAYRSATPPTSHGLGTPWLSARAAMLRAQDGLPFNLAGELSASLPLGSVEALAGDGFAMHPRLQFGFQQEDYQVGGEVGTLLRPRKDLSPLSGRADDVIGSELRLGATVTNLGDTSTHTRRELSVLLSLPLAGGRPSAEVLVGIRKHTLPGLDVFVLGGPALGSACDIPVFRVVAGASFANFEVD